MVFKSLSYLPNVFVCYCEIVKEEWSLNPYHIFQIALPGSLIARQHRWYKYAVLWQQHNIRYLQFVLPSDLILLLNKLVPKKSKIDALVRAPISSPNASRFLCKRTQTNHSHFYEKLHR